MKLTSNSGFAEQLFSRTSVLTRWNLLLPTRSVGILPDVLHQDLEELCVSLLFNWSPSITEVLIYPRSPTQPHPI